MPTYDYKCPSCGHEESVVQSISEYTVRPRRPFCMEHGQMERKLSVSPFSGGVFNPLAGDRHYEGLRATDGTDIGSRTKHREYMRRNELSTADDWKTTWASAKVRREEFLQAKHEDKGLREEITKQVMQQVIK